MMGFLMESVIVSFALGGIVGAVIAMHLMHPKKDAVALRKRSNAEALEP
jgi:phosphotransferase system  glucose/maltose/N-acetylglucosamine-specific IIC component